MSKYLTRLPPNTSPELSRALSDAFRDLFNDLVRQGKLFAQDVDPRDTGAILVDGARWVHTETAKVYTWVDDGTSAQWVELCCGGGGGGGGVESINALTGDITLTAGANVTITPSGNTLTIASTGGGGGSPGGSNGQVQYRINSTTFGGISGVTTDGANLVFGVGARLIGEFGNATISNRPLFQSSALNVGTSMGAIPNGTSQDANMIFFDNSAPNNSSYSVFGVNASGPYLQTSAAGTGTTKEFRFLNNIGVVGRFDASGNWALGNGAGIVPGYSLATTGAFYATGNVVSNSGIVYAGGGNSPTTGQITLDNGTSNWAYWRAVGLGEPAFTTRTAGTKLVLYPLISGSFTDYAIGVANNRLWLSVPTTATQWISLYGGTTEYMRFDASGFINCIGSSRALQMNGTQVVGNRVTGWGAPTGTLTRTTFDSGTVTLAQLAERVAALITDLRTHGLIGN